MRADERRLFGFLFFVEKIFFVHRLLKFSARHPQGGTLSITPRGDPGWPSFCQAQWSSRSLVAVLALAVIVMRGRTSFSTANNNLAASIGFRSKASAPCD